MVVNFATSKIIVVNSTMFPYHNTHQYTWISPEGKTHNLIECGAQVYLMSDLSEGVFMISLFHGCES
jgi:hypothetical protein